MGDNGEAIIVWRQSDKAVDAIFKSEYRKGAWTNPTSFMPCSMVTRLRSTCSAQVKA